MNENLLRDLHELTEVASDGKTVDPEITHLLDRRAWSPSALRRTVKRLRRQQMLHHGPGLSLRLTDTGIQSAREVVRRHRLWETYLISHADVAPGVVDLSADRIEHVLDPDLIRQLEATLADQAGKELPRSPHELVAEKGVP